MTTVATKSWWMLDLPPGRETHDNDCGDEELVDGDCQHINEVFDAVPGSIYDDNNDIVSSLSVIPNEIVAYIIHLVLLSDLTMLGNINRVSETLRECATVAMTNRWPRLHLSEFVAEALRLRPNIESTVCVRRFMRETLPGSGAACRLREFLAGNTQWYNASITMMPESLCWYRIIDIFWRRRR